MLVSGLAPMLAPTLGGLLLARLSWRAIFWTLVGVGTACALATYFLLPETNRHLGTRSSLGDTLRVYLKLVRDPAFLGYTLVGAAGSVGMFVYITGSPFVFIELFEVSAAGFGLYFGLNALGMTLGSQSNRLLARWTSPERVLLFGTWGQALAGAALLLGALLSGIGGLAGIAVPLFVYQVCNGVVFPNTTALAMARSGRHAGSASALIGTFQFFLAAAASALLSAFHAETARPMGGLIALCGVAGILLYRRALREEGKADQRSGVA
jgi:DHA1 family bicyclomycin/chloramphenicol resistance-like MFS transporter